MAIKPRPVHRARSIKVAGQETPAERQARSAVRYIMDNRYYPYILRAIQEGTPNTRIAETGIERGWFDQNQKTVVSYLQYFRRQQPGLCKPQKSSLDQDNGDAHDLSFVNLFDLNGIVIDEEVELLRLIRLQQARLGIAFRSERNITMLMGSTRREVTELRELIMELARLRGNVKSSMDVNVNGYTQTVKEELKGIQQDEQQRSVIATLVQDLVGLSNG